MPPTAVNHRYLQSDQADEKRWGYAQARGIRKISRQQLHASREMWTPLAGSVIAGPLGPRVPYSPMQQAGACGVACIAKAATTLVPAQSLPHKTEHVEDVDASPSQVQTRTIVYLDQCLMLGRPVQHKTSEIPGWRINELWALHF